jgi:hippurate hydrolase
MSTTLPFVAAEMTAWRHDLHAHPEFGFELTGTAAEVAELVKRYRDEVAAQQA